MRALALGVLACVTAAPPAHAASEAEPARKDVVKQVQGSVSAVNAHGIAVERARTERQSEEMYLPFGPQMQWQGVRGPAELGAGDTVLVRYRETLLKDADGKLTRPARTASGVALVARAPAAPDAPDAADEVSDE